MMTPSSGRKRSGLIFNKHNVIKKMKRGTFEHRDSVVIPETETDQFIKDQITHFVSF